MNVPQAKKLNLVVIAALALNSTLIVAMDKLSSSYPNQTPVGTWKQ